MGRKSVKDNKNIYQTLREECGYTRAKACEDSFISESRLEKIESGKVTIQTDEVKELSRIYKKPSLNNYYCSHLCPIGINNIMETPDKDLSEITIETLSLLNKLDKQKNKLIEIAADNKLDESEYTDFLKIKKDLEQISLAVDSLKLWLDERISEGVIDKEKLEPLE
ncbi:MAG: helix-turn-helix transcriptional regulator [Erysipelotrichaceae bacterium]|nr:helix-turn-helix transcriptional regulator [Erysipelotrichaceae bacterium]